jgi:O-antigen/teichoic acid export membrane protein
MRLVSSAVVLSASRIVTLLGAALINILTARALGPAGRGSYALPSIDASLASTFLLGLQTATSYFMLSRHAQRGLIRPVLVAFAAFIVGGCLAATAIAILNRHTWAAIPAMLYLPCSAALSLVSGYWVGRDRMKTLSVVNVSTVLATLACVGIALVVLGRTPWAAICGWLVGQALVAVWAIVLVLRDAREPGQPVGVLEYVRYAAKAGSLNMMTLLSYRVDVFVVAAFAPLAVLGLYTVAVAGAESTLTLTHTISFVTAPRIGAIDRRAAAEFAARCTRSTLVFATLLATIIAFLAPLVVHLLFGARFLPLVPALRVLLVGVVALSTGGVITNYFMLNRGMVYVPLTTWGISAAISAGLSLLLVPRLGMIGAAVSVASAYVVGQVAAVVCFSRDTGLHPLRLLIIEREDVVFYRRLLLTAWHRLRPAT